MSPDRVHAILERAASEGRPPTPANDAADHDPVPPVMRCQVCGVRLLVGSPDVIGRVSLWITHDPEPEL